MRIIEDDLTHPSVVALLSEHLAAMVAHSPPDSVHALDLAGLKAGDMTVYTAWKREELLGFGALRALAAHEGEIKSLRTSRAHLERGVATAILRHLIQTARQRSYSRLSLETGSGPAFEPAHSLYRKFGFEYCGPFAEYRDDPFSRFMTLQL